MKKLLIVLLGLSLVSASLRAQTRLGIDGGFNIAYMTGSSDSRIGTAPFLGGNISFSSEFMFNELIGLRTGVGYSLQGITAAYQNKLYDHLMGHYINIPLMLTFSFADNSILLGIGPQLGICAEIKEAFVLDDGSKTYWDSVKLKAGEQYNVCDASIDIMARFLFTEHFGLKLQYNFGVSDVLKGEIPTKYGTRIIGNNFNFVGQVGVIYLFDEL